MRKVIEMHRNRSAHRRRGLKRQRLRRRCEREVRRSAVAFSRWCQGRGLGREVIAEHLRLRPETLRRWEQRWQEDRMALKARGRRPDHAERELRREILAVLGVMGPNVGLPSLQNLFPQIARGELRELQRHARRDYRHRRRWCVHMLRWARAGAVWAIDFTDPPTPIDGLYPKVLCVRDLASGNQLLAMPCLDKSTQSVIAVLRMLGRVWGLPLVIKCDNDGAFRADELRDWADSQSVLLLFSPEGLPEYNGAVEAGIGSIKTRAHHEAARQGRPGEWTCDDLEVAVELANRTARPRGRLGPTPYELWRDRSPLADCQRQRLRAVYRKHYAKECSQRGLLWATDLQHPDRAAIDRVAISRALIELGFLFVTRKRFALPFRKPKAGIIS